MFTTHVFCIDTDKHGMVQSHTTHGNAVWAIAGSVNGAGAIKISALVDTTEPKTSQAYLFAHTGREIDEELFEEYEFTPAGYYTTNKGGGTLFALKQRNKYYAELSVILNTSLPTPNTLQILANSIVSEFFDPEMDNYSVEVKVTSTESIITLSIERVLFEEYCSDIITAFKSVPSFDHIKVVV